MDNNPVVLQVSLMLLLRAIRAYPLAQQAARAIVINRHFFFRRVKPPTIDADNHRETTDRINSKYS